MRLGKILLYTILGGFSLAFSQLVGSGDSGFGVFGTIVYLLSGNLDSRFQSILFFVTTGFTILLIYGTSRLLVQIYHNKINGICVALFGFIGALCVFLLSAQNNQYIFLGAGCWIAGIVIVARNRSQTKTPRHFQD
jgi:hypothetical protein